jgi:putative tryptophan/tyrosine transport system substrate-binding protein
MTTQHLSPLTMLLSRHTRRREFITLLGGAAAAWPIVARAQQTAVPLIGVLSPVSAAVAVRYIAALRQGLRDLGYTEGRNIKIEYRFAQGSSDRLTTLATELASLSPIAIIVGSTIGVVQASKATRKIPLIMIGGTEDPVRLGLAESFAHPGGNVTGFLMTADQEILGKRLQLLRDAVPGITRIGIMANPDSAGDAAELRIAPSVAERVGLQCRLFEPRTDAELDAALAAAAKENLEALYFSWNPLFNFNRTKVIAAASSLHLPTTYGLREFVQSGGLMSYGPDLADLYRRTAAYIDKIIKGAQPGELPLQLAEKHELVINLRTAKALGLTISEPFLLLADEVIE